MSDAESPPLPEGATEGAFAEAIAWFRNKLSIKKDDWRQLNVSAQKRAFTVAGVGRLSLMDDVFKAIDTALVKGETLADFKKRVRAKLEREWGEEKPGRVENIFRTNIQHAYSHGRYEQATQPETLGLRPYWRFVATLDSRTSTFCRPLNGITLPATHPFWMTHLPPLHFQCRSTFTTLRASVAKKEGITRKVPKVEPLEGFGHAVGTEWEPDLASFDRQLVSIFRRAK